MKIIIFIIMLFGLNYVSADEVSVSGQIKKNTYDFFAAVDKQDFSFLNRFFCLNFSDIEGDGSGISRSVTFVPPNSDEEGYPQMQYHPKILEIYIDVVNENTAVATGIISGKTTTGSEIYKGVARFSIYWFKEKGDWKMASSHFSEYNVQKLEYFLQKPTDFDSNKKYPLIVFLHGTGERGNFSKLELMAKRHSIPKIAAETKDFPFIVVSPLCPKYSTWAQQIYNLNMMLDEITAALPVDEKRIYLTGISMGGVGTWSWAMTNPERFAAIAPVCGFNDPKRVENIKNIPVWAFHGELDPIVPIEKEKAVVDALLKIGGNVKFTAYPDVGHDSWNNAYATKELYDWFLRYKKE